MASFNPRAHVGRDFRLIHVLIHCLVSIHAPTWGATEGERAVCLAVQFQSTRPRGARHMQGWPKEFDRWVSIHAPTWGATMHMGIVHSESDVSIHAPTWGATPN